MIGYSELNEMQQKVVKKTDGPLLVLAGAGSGKTGALTVRVANMLENGIRPWNILAITFTNKAAKEMRERINAIAGDAARDVWISTFHSTCVRILRRDIEKIGYGRSFAIYDTDDQERIMKESFKRLNFSLTDKSLSVKSAIAEVGRQKEELVSPEDYASGTDNDPRRVKISKAYTVYQQLLKSNNALDFDDLIYKTVMLFRNCPEVLDYYQERFKYIMVDEYQDTNTSQYEFVRMLAAKYSNLCVVGDDDQSIYGWRGANIRNILDFEKDFPDTAVVKLEQNYRSTKTILEAANSVIHNNIKRKDKALWTDNETGSIIHIYKADNESDEARFIAEKIKEENARGEKYNNFAVLYRTNAQSRAVEDKLVKMDVPYKIYGGIRFYERKEIKDIISYLKAIVNPADTIALRRIVNAPKRGIGEASMDKVAAFAELNSITLYEAMGRAREISELKTRAGKIHDFYMLMEELKECVESKTAAEALDCIIEKTMYASMLKEEATDEAIARLENIDEFVSKAAEYEKTADEPSVQGFLEEVALVADIDSLNENEDFVSLMTLHSAKGLEFPYVFITGMEEGLFPGFRAVTYGGPEEIEEERRLCYVGITRARRMLFLSHARSRMQHGISQYNAPSRFLKEIPAELINSPKSVISGEAGSYAKKAAMRITPAFKKPGMHNAARRQMPSPAGVTLDYVVGDKVRAPKYGIGTVKSIMPGGADFEVEVNFPESGTKKFMAGLSKLKKV